MGCCGDEVEPEKDEKQDDFDGPMKNRGCTDVICLLIFAAYIGGMIYVLIVALMLHGDPWRLVNGFDVKGDTCGRSNSKLTEITNLETGVDLSDKTLLYFDLAKTALIFAGDDAEFTKWSTAAGVEIASGTTAEEFQNANKAEFCLTGTVTITETNGTNAGGAVNDTAANEKLANELQNADPVQSALTGGNTCRYCVSSCPGNHIPFFMRCIPKQGVVHAEGIFKATVSGTDFETYFEELANDITRSWKEITYMCLVALGLSIVMVILFRFLAGIIVYIIIISVAIVCIVGPCVLWYVWYTKKTDYDSRFNNGAAVDANLQQGNNGVSAALGSSAWSKADSEEEVTNYLTIAIVATVVAVILLLILIVMRKRIALVVQLFKEAGKAVAAMPLLLLQPLWTFLALVILAFVWTVSMAIIESAGNPEQDSKTNFVTYKKTEFLFWMRIYHLFGGLWLMNFIIACQHIVIAGAVAGWYFTIDKDKLGFFPIGASIWRLVRYHLGSIAFGSFIIALIQLIRMIMAYVERKLAKKRGVSTIVGPILKCCQCCLWCFEKCMKFLNKNAYIEVAIYGYNFCKAARKAFLLLAANVLRVAAINSVGTFVLFLGKVAVVISTVFIGIEIMQTQPDDNKAKHVWAPITLAAIFAYMTIDCFIGVYGMAIDTIFLCFCEDNERNDGSDAKPYYMSVGLMKFVDNSKKALESLKYRQSKKEAKKSVKEDRITLVHSANYLTRID